MAHFLGTMRGTARTDVSRTGTKVSGLTGHLRGWDIGCRVELAHIDGKDVVRVYKTGGSSGATNEELIAEFSE